VALTVLVREESSVAEVALVAVGVVVHVVAMGMATMELVMMVVMEEAALVTLEEAQAMEVVPGLWKPGQWLWWEWYV
jgi:hypothetical protein